MLGLEASQPEKLRSVPLDALLDAQERCAADGPYETGMLFAPVVDGDTLPDRRSPASLRARRGTSS